MLLAGAAAHKKKKSEKSRYQRWQAFCHLHYEDKIKEVYFKRIHAANAAVKEGVLEKVNHLALLREVVLQVLEDEPDEVQERVEMLVNPESEDSSEGKGSNIETGRAGKARDPNVIQQDTAMAYMM